MNKNKEFQNSKTNDIALNAIERRFYNVWNYYEMYYNQASNLMISAATILTFQGAIGAIILNLNINLTFISKIIFIISFIIPLVFYALSINFSVKSYDFVLIRNCDRERLREMAKNNVDDGMITANLIDDYIEAQNENIKLSKPTLRYIELAVTFLKLGIYSTVIYLCIMGMLYLFF